MVGVCFWVCFIIMLFVLNILFVFFCIIFVDWCVFVEMFLRFLFKLLRMLKSLYFDVFVLEERFGFFFGEYWKGFVCFNDWVWIFWIGLLIGFRGFEFWIVWFCMYFFFFIFNFMIFEGFVSWMGLVGEYWVIFFSDIVFFLIMKIVLS